MIKVVLSSVLSLEMKIVLVMKVLLKRVCMSFEMLIVLIMKVLLVRIHIVLAFIVRIFVNGIFFVVVLFFEHGICLLQACNDAGN